ncbi:LANO_0G15060g1_1 [Lachancea nothofagi CBS 11611]|uniref:LANO_0G15060g1_1 n=1 Tax=Lachancea nothofagi CBS 11611 TaxID=1266666 RepID=A0A1G4KKL1_9SACH|nr:LANO_0G15060g1_1 [Lachancea nothofagi CBS 11611]
MSSQVVDKIFDTGFYWFKKAESINRRVLDNVKDLGSGASNPITDPLERQVAPIGIFHGFENQKVLKTISALGLSAAALLMWRYGGKLLPRPPAHLKQGDKTCVLLFGHMRDPITRQIVMDLYRRGFIVFVCSENGASENDDDGLFHIAPIDLNNMIKYLHEMSAVLSSILIVPNSAYYPSGVFTTLSSSVVQSEMEQNVFAHIKALVKLLPHLTPKLQIILMTPSLPLNYGIPHHSPEYFIAGLMQSFHRALKYEYPQSRIYLCHLGVLKIAGSSSSYKYLSASGSNISKSLLMPLYNLIVSRKSWWFNFIERLAGDQRFYGKWSRLGYFLGSWTPLFILKVF